MTLRTLANGWPLGHQDPMGKVSPYFWEVIFFYTQIWGFSCSSRTPLWFSLSRTPLWLSLSRTPLWLKQLETQILLYTKHV